MDESDVQNGAPDQDEQSTITAWHHLLVQTMERLIAPELLTIHPFFRLGSLPLEADIIALLGYLSGEELAARVPEFDFMLRHMAELTVVEYKGPRDRLTLAGFTTALAYAFLARRKLKQQKKLRPLRQMCLQVLYSHREKDLLEVLAADGFVFEQVEAGILRCGVLRMPIYLMDLVTLSDQHPERLISLLSARYKRYRLPLGPEQAHLARLYYTVFQELTRMLSNEKLKNLPGASEVMAEMDEIRRQIAAQLRPEDMRDVPVEVRLHGLSPEDRLHGLSPEDLDRLRVLLNRSKT